MIKLDVQTEVDWRVVNIHGVEDDGCLLIRDNTEKNYNNTNMKKSTVVGKGLPYFDLYNIQKKRKKKVKKKK